ncbi:MAG: type II 3-dehydroquinate dehydratase [Ectothiorhodospiraceae bacterium]|nr:type II 3-dehydroquinate dehydratase [Chromatiales bacterium]MCP5157012.1 type II 3-dehydroquinate dehydratase [Ectothiorhodospiraceae bacterium]
MASLLLLNGPNLNLLGTREPQHYGSMTLADVEARLGELARADGHTLESFQSNAEYALIDRVQAAGQSGVDMAIINPGGLTHTSVALRDAFAGVKLPFIEIHISNIHRREPFRHHSYFSDVAVGSIIGLGPIGYELAYRAAVAHLAGRPKG